MRVVGLDETGRSVLDRELAHGADPESLAFDAGYLVTRPLTAVRDARQELVLRLEVRPADGAPAPVGRARGRDRHLVLGDEVPVRRQRAAAYAVVVSELGLLCTEYSDRTAVPGRWGMPGGGIDDDEEPAAAVVREVTEETAQTVRLQGLCRVQTSHWVGRSPRGTIEDFHAVRLVYRAQCDHPSPPTVLDVGGTTESARWVPLDSWSALRWTHNWRTILAELLA